MHNGNRPFKCPACPKIFGSRGDLKRHQIIHSGIKPWICTVCSVPFNRKDKLVRHEKLHSGEPRPFQCYECPTSFSRKEDLTKHIQFHHYKPVSSIMKFSIYSSLGVASPLMNWFSISTSWNEDLVFMITFLLDRYALLQVLVAQVRCKKNSQGRVKSSGKRCSFQWRWVISMVL